MLKRHSQFVVSLLVLSDLITVALSWLIAFAIRATVSFAPIGPMEPSLFPTYLKEIPVVAIVAALTFRHVGLYIPRREGTFLKEAYDIIKGNILACFLLMGVAFFYKSFHLARGFVVFYLVVACAALVLSRGSVRSILRKCRRRGWNLRYVLIVGSGKLGQKVVERIERNPWTGLKAIGYVDDRNDRVGKTFFGVEVLGTLDDINRIISERTVDQLICALPFEEHWKLKKLTESLSEQTVDVRIVPDLFAFMALRSTFGEFDGLPIVTLQETPLYGWNRVLKRVMDVLLSLLAMPFVIFSTLIFAPIIKLTSPGPLFYRQSRMGLDGRTFDMLKFRTMPLDAEAQTGAVWAKPDDPRRTRIGTFLRKTSIDELPQFFNVLKGEMSIVGPRPERPVFIEQFKKSIPKYMLRHKMKSGITGWAQVNGWRGDTSLEKRIQYDIYYIENWSLWFDFRIMILTIFRGLVSKHAY